ncbi:MAG: hypothetical protein ACREMQ_19940 [Longimicrobiales bacterium]
MVILRIAHERETAEVPIDLDVPPSASKGRTGPTAARDREARLDGRSTIDVPIDRVRGSMHCGELIFTARSASVQRYTNKLTLTLAVRADNRSGYTASFSDAGFRLVLDGLPRAPVGGLNEIVDAGTVKDGDVEFDLPLTARDVRNGDTTREPPLQLRLPRKR